MQCPRRQHDSPPETAMEYRMISADDHVDIPGYEGICGSTASQPNGRSHLGCDSGRRLMVAWLNR